MNITRGKVATALKVVVYGPEGIGKSTFAAQFPGAVFIDTEGSTSHMDVARFDKPEKWMDIHAALDWAAAHPAEVGTVVIDTADWAEKMAARYVCNEEPINKSGDTRHWDSIEAPGYGKGYVYLKAAFLALLDKATGLTEKGINVVITAHAILKKFEQPDEMGSYDRWALKLNEKNVAPVVKEWADMVLFANYKTDVIKASDGKTNKARGGQKRIMYTQHNACWDAKNRFGLEDGIPFEFAQIAHLFSEKPAVKEIHEPEPEPPKKEPIQVTPPKASVSTGGTIPDVQPGKPAPTAQEIRKEREEANALAAGKARKPRKAEKDDAPKTRPPMMQSDDPEKDKALATLWEKMRAGGIDDPLILMAVVAERDYYDVKIPVKEYETDFINDVLIEAWDQVRGLCQTKMNDLPF